MQTPKDFCGHCGKRRLLKTVFIQYAGQVRQLDMCRPCHQAVKEAMRHEASKVQEPVAA